MAINKVEANGETLIDLTSDTATANDVIEGKTLHLASGAVATGTYRPSDEIEARLRATVGHSSKNLLKITADSQTINGVTFTVDKTAGTITVNGQVSSSATMAQLDIVSRRDVDSSLNGLILTEPASKTIPNYGFRTAITYYNSSGTYISEQVINSGNPNPVVVSVPSNAYTYKVYVRATTPAGTLNNLVIKPMFREASISDDTFEPYKIPTDERVSSTDERVSSLDIATANVSQYVPDPNEGIYWITIIDHYSTWNNRFDIYISTPNSDGGYFFGALESYPIPEHEVKLPRFHSYKENAISFGLIAGTSDPVMAISSNPGMFSSSHTTSMWDKQFSVGEFFDFCDVKDGSATNYMHIHLCDDGGIRNQADYEAYIGG